MKTYSAEETKELIYGDFEEYFDYILFGIEDFCKYKEFEDFKEFQKFIVFDTPWRQDFRLDKTNEIGCMLYGFPVKNDKFKIFLKDYGRASIEYEIEREYYLEAWENVCNLVEECRTTEEFIMKFGNMASGI